MALFGIRGVIDNFRLDGHAMEPTLQSGDSLLVDRLSYRVREPERGDIIVFDAWYSDRAFIKRIVGLPGENVEIRDGLVLIDGRELEEPYLEQPTLDHIGPVELDRNEYYVIGDNRGNSSDSRAYGPLPEDLIHGRAVVVYFPLDRFGQTIP